MIQIIYLIECLERTPVILANLLKHIPQEIITEQRVNGKWSIHEQVCHLTEAQEILIERFQIFEKEENPLIKRYEPPIDQATDYYLNMDLKAELDRFKQIRNNMVLMLRAFDEEYWSLTGRHEVFTPYNTQVLLSHCLNVDYAHLFSIEQLGFTKNDFTKEILTIP